VVVVRGDFITSSLTKVGKSEKTSSTSLLTKEGDGGKDHLQMGEREEKISSVS